jgi:hypothetical protein
MYRLTAACGATLPDQVDDPRRDASAPRKDGRLTFAVFDTDTALTRPSNGDGKPAPCMFGCPKKKASGRKHMRCFPTDEAEAFKRWRHVVMCAFTVSEVEVLQ